MREVSGGERGNSPVTGSEERECLVLSRTTLQAQGLGLKILSVSVSVAGTSRPPLRAHEELEAVEDWPSDKKAP